MIQKGDPQDIILKPADSYITDFIKDINRSRVIKIGSIMEKATRASGPKLVSNTSVEEALQIMTSADKSVAAVVDTKGKTIGKISLEVAITTIARPVHDNKEPRYK